VSIQGWLVARSNKAADGLRRRQFERVITRPDEAPKDSFAALAIYALCITYWLVTAAVIVICLSVWWWSDQGFTKILFTVLGVGVLALSAPKRLRNTDYTLWSDNGPVHEFVGASCEAIDHKKPKRIGFNLGWPTSWVPGNAGRESAVTIGTPLWAAITPDVRAALVVASMAASHEGRRNYFLVRVTTSSLEEWMKFCNFDVDSLVGTWNSGISWTTTMAGGAGIDDIAYVRVTSSIAGWFLGIVGIVPAVTRTLIGLADVTTDEGAAFDGVRASVELTGTAATLAAIEASLSARDLDAAMQREVLSGGKRPLAAAKARGAEVLAGSSGLATAAGRIEFEGKLGPKQYIARYALAVPYANGTRTDLGAAGNSEIPADAVASIDRELCGVYQYRYSFGGN
jgi:hypothetical protein